MKHTTTLRNSLAKWFSLAALISLFAFAPSKSSAQLLCGAGFQYTVDSSYTVQFWDSSYSPNGYTCQWSFGNGTSSTDYNPVVAFNANGPFIVCLTITDSINGCTSTTCDSIYLYGGGGGCYSNYSFTVSGDSVQFTDTSPAAVAWSWDFNDGSPLGTSANPMHIYPLPGLYYVCLTTTDSSGCTSSYCTYINVNSGSGCVASFTAANNGGNTIAFTNTSSGGFFTNYYWTFGDGSYSFSANPNHTYASSGVYSVCLTITDSNGLCTDTYCDSVYVSGGSSSCNASFTFNANVNTVSFVNTSSGNFTDAQWSFGDGTGATGLAGATHTYSSNGPWTICLTISDSAGTCQDTYCTTITLGVPNNNYFITGMISGNNSPIDFAEVYLIQYDSITQSLNLISTYEVSFFDSSYYIFSNLAAGSYLVKAAADTGAVDYATLIPTYYNNSLFWSSASFVNVGPSQYGVNINMIQGVNPGGPGFIGGLVSQGANKMEAEGDPLSGIQIMLLNMNNTAVANTYSDVNGNYSFANIAYGTYKVYAEILNKVTYPAVVTIDATTPSINNVAVIVNTNEVTTATPYLDLTNIESALLYPNPARGSATLNLNLTQAGDYTIQITDMTGRLMNAETVTLQQGENLVKLAVQNFDAGLYMVQVSDAISNFNMKLTVVK
ncbi:MAG: PKD domain-containing protein [Bacteroidota bacterium]